MRFPAFCSCSTFGIGSQIHSPNSVATNFDLQPHPDSHPLKQPDCLFARFHRGPELASLSCQSLPHSGRALSPSPSPSFSLSLLPPPPPLSLSVCVCASSDVMEGNRLAQQAMPPQSAQGQGSNSHVLGTRPSCRICGYFSLAEREVKAHWNAVAGMHESGAGNRQGDQRPSIWKVWDWWGQRHDAHPVVRERPPHRQTYRTEVMVQHAGTKKVPKPARALGQK
jgi:hypothetical protein